MILRTIVVCGLENPKTLREFNDLVLQLRDLLESVRGGNHKLVRLFLGGLVGPGGVLQEILQVKYTTRVVLCFLGDDR